MDKDLAELNYKVVKDEVIITGFKNLKTREEIVDKYGVETLGFYEALDPRMFLIEDKKTMDEKIIIHYNAQWNYHEIAVGDVFEKKEFSNIVVLMKESGKNLVKSIAKGRKAAMAEVKTFVV